MPTIRPTTELDFDQLKSEIINYIKSNPTYSDYNFEGSALNAIADMLAFNTHQNAYYANMVHNEGFIDTAQKRSSVVSKAKELGYTPRSCVCSSAYINLSVLTTNSLNSIVLERGTSFTSSNDNGSHKFLVVNSTSSSYSNNIHIFNNVKILNGALVKNYFKVDTMSNVRSIFKIPNKSIDTSTLRVFVRDSASALEQVEYIISDNVYENKSNSNVFFLQESYDGFYQIFFGGGVIGKQPVDGNVIDIDYFISLDNELADGCREFGFNGSIGSSASIDIITTQVSFGGSDREKIDSIKLNAVRSNSAKERAVTESDYVLMLKEKFNFVKSASVWGGENNIPPVYGKVFISIQPVSGYTISDYVKTQVITPEIKKNSLLTIGIEYADPTYLELFISTKIKFNYTKTTVAISEIESYVKNIIYDYIESISYFNKDYLESTLIGNIMDCDSGVISTTVDKIVGFKISPLTNVKALHTRYINNQILSGSIFSTKFQYYHDNEIVEVVVKEIVGGSVNVITKSGNVELQLLGLYDSSNKLIVDVGTVDLLTGNFNLTITPYSYVSNILIAFKLVENDIMMYRNQILRMEKNSDIQIENNYVLVESYGK